MSKILFALLSLFTLVACGDTADKPTPQPQQAAPQLALSYQGKVYASGSTIDIAAIEHDFGGDIDFMEVKAGDESSPRVVLNPEAKGQSSTWSSPLRFTATVTATDFSRFLWCGIEPQCKPLSQTTEVRHGELSAGMQDIPLQLDCSFAPQQYATVTATLHLQATGEKNPAVYTLRYIYSKP